MGPPPDSEQTAIVGFHSVQRVAQSYLGSLWIALDQRGAEPGTPVLLRHVQLPGGTPAEARQRIAQAGRDAIELRHDNVLLALDVIEHGETLAVVYEHLEAEPLRSLQSWANLRGLSMPVGVSLRIIIDLLRGVEALHSALLGSASAPAFGGLSPDSVLVARDGRTRLSDALVASCATLLEGVGANTAKLAYAAPEQVHATAPLTAPCDVFTCGAMLWELLASRRLLSGSRAAIERRLLEHNLPSLGAHLRSDQRVSSELIEIVGRTLAGDTQKRPPTAQALASALEQCGHEVASQEQVAEFVGKLSGPRFDRRSAAIRSRSLPALETPPQPPAQVAPASASGRALRASPPPASALVPPSPAPEPAPRSAPKSRGERQPRLPRLKGPMPTPSRADAARPAPRSAPPPSTLDRARAAAAALPPVVPRAAGAPTAGPGSPPARAHPAPASPASPGGALPSWGEPSPVPFPAESAPHPGAADEWGPEPETVARGPLPGLPSPVAPGSRTVAGLGGSHHPALVPTPPFAHLTPPPFAAPAPSISGVPAPSFDTLPAPSARSAPAPSISGAPAPSVRSSPEPSIISSAPALSVGSAPPPAVSSAPGPVPAERSAPAWPSLPGPGSSFRPPALQGLEPTLAMQPQELVPRVAPSGRVRRPSGWAHALGLGPVRSRKRAVLIGAGATAALAGAVLVALLLRGPEPHPDLAVAAPPAENAKTASAAAAHRPLPPSGPSEAETPKPVEPAPSTSPEPSGSAGAAPSPAPPPDGELDALRLSDAQLSQLFALERRATQPTCPERLGASARRHTGKSAKKSRAQLKAARRALMRGQNDRAHALLCSATAHSAANTAAWQALADLTLHLGDPEQAKAAAEQGLKRTPRNRKLLGILGDTWAMLGDLPQARDLWARSTNTRGSDAERGPILTALFQKIGDRMRRASSHGAARVYYRRAVVTSAASHDPSVGLGEALRQLGQSPAALAWAERAARAHPQDARVQVLLGDALYDHGRVDEARRAWQTAHDVQPDNAIATRRLAKGKP